MLLWKLFKTSFCAVCAITKCTSLQPTVSGIPARRGKKHIKNKKSQRRFKVRTKTKKM